MQKDIKVVNNEIPYYNDRIVEVERVIETQVPVERVIKEIVEVPYVVEKLVNQMITVPEIH